MEGWVDLGYISTWFTCPRPCRIAGNSHLKRDRTEIQKSIQYCLTNPPPQSLGHQATWQWHRYRVLLLLLVLVAWVSSSSSSSGHLHLCTQNQLVFTACLWGHMTWGKPLRLPHSTPPHLLSPTLNTVAALYLGTTANTLPDTENWPLSKRRHNENFSTVAFAAKYYCCGSD